MATGLSSTTTQTTAALPLPVQQCSACCPNCRRSVTFRFGGEQVWPLEVALKAGLPQRMTLWHCNCCNSTFADYQLGKSAA